MIDALVALFKKELELQRNRNKWQAELEKEADWKTIRYFDNIASGQDYISI